MDDFKSSDKLEAEFNLDDIAQGDIQSVKQRGNFLEIVTTTGTHFSKGIPPGKILNIKDGKYILQDMQA